MRESILKQNKMDNKIHRKSKYSIINNMNGA